MNKKIKGIMVLAIVAIFGILALSLSGCGSGYGHMMGSGGRGDGWHQRGGYSTNLSGNADYYGNNYGNSGYMVGNGPGLNGYCSP